MMSSFEQRVNHNLRWAFFLVLSVKILAAIIAFATDEAMLWGIVIPLGVFALYIAYGVKLVWEASDRTRLNFADGCYYLGFLFTITTIVLALADAAQAGELRVSDISIRFAGAMASTVIGMVVRLVYVLFERKRQEKGNTSATPSTGLFSSLFPHQDQKRDTVSYGAQVRATTASDPFEAQLQACAKNLSLFNALISQSLQEFEDLNDRLKTLNARILADADVTREELRAASTDWIKTSQAQQAELMATLRDGLKAELAANTEASLALTRTHADALKHQTEAAAQRLNENVERSVDALVATHEVANQRLAKDAQAVHKALSGLTADLEALNRVEHTLTESVGTVRTQMEASARNFSALSQQLQEKVDLRGVQTQINALEASTRDLNEGLHDLARQVKTDGLHHLTTVSQAPWRVRLSRFLGARKKS